MRNDAARKGSPSEEGRATYSNTHPVIQWRPVASQEIPSSSELSVVFTDGVVANLPAFVHLVLNRQVWKKAPEQVQEILFESLAR